MVRRAPFAPSHFRTVAPSHQNGLHHLRTMHRHQGYGVRGRVPGRLHSPRKDEAAFQTAEMLYIHPDECIDCGACVPACPVDAIFSLDETPSKWAAFIQKNREYY